MKKIMVIGCPGSGKSTFSRALHKILGIPIFYLDMMFWNADKTTVERPVFMERLNKVLERDEWIIDGNYMFSMEIRMTECDTVIFLDYPTDICLAGIKERKGKPRADMPWIETEDDPEFIEYVRGFNTQLRPRILELIERFSNKNTVTFTARGEADEFLASLKR